MAASGKKSLKYYIGKLHLWLGLPTGLVVFIVAITGCIYCFQDEIKALYEVDTTVELQETPVLPPSKAQDIALDILPGRTIHGIAYGEKNEAIEVVFYEAEPEFYQTLYLNPYSGELIYHENVLKGFFPFILDGHMNLWMGEFGRKIVSYSTLIFLFILISGLFLWFPRKRKNAGKRFKFQWKDRTKWKRKNYDLHNILGFYASAIALIIAATGLVMAFNWFQEGVYRVAGGDRQYSGFEHPVNISTSSDTDLINEDAEPIDIIWSRLMQEYPDAYEVEMHIPPADGYAIYAHMRFSGGTYWDADYRYFDSQSLEEIKSDSPYGTLEEASVADLLRVMNYDIHVGAIGGIAGKIIVFFSSLIVGSLPVTGFIIWWGRKGKANSSTPNPRKNRVRKRTYIKQKKENKELVEA